MNMIVRREKEGTEKGGGKGGGTEAEVTVSPGRAVGASPQ